MQVKVRGKVTEDAWRAVDRRRALLILALSALVAAAVTAVLYFV